MMLSVGDFVVAIFSVEMSDSSDISSRSRFPVEVAKSWPYSTKVDSLVSSVSSPFRSMSVPVISHGRFRMDLNF